MRLQFGGCVLDTDTRELTRGSANVPLSPKAFRLLEILVERRPQVITHDHLRQELWPDTVAGGTTIARIVNEVRDALLDHAKPPKLIRTVHRVGYGFCGTVTIVSPAIASTRFSVNWGSRHVPLLAGENIIGRAADAIVSLPSSTASRRHARIMIRDGSAILEDLASKNGTFVGEKRVMKPLSLKNGDQIVIGSTTLIFCDSDESAT
jgi:DNA-binding winged helix-turn-helix (wHTH) protein